MQLTTEERIFVVTAKLRNVSVINIQREFRERFGREPPCKTTILRNCEKYRLWGTSLNRNAFNSGRRRTTRNNPNIQPVRNVIENNVGPISARRNGLGLPKSIFNEITRLDLNLHPYRIMRRHELLKNDFIRRMNFTRWFLQQCEDPNFINLLVIGDEAAFCMNGEVNTKNVVKYAPKGEPPVFNYDKNASREKLTVWIGLCGNGSVLGPYFFENNVTGERYLEMLNVMAIPQLSLEYMMEFNRLWWAQDGAGPHRYLPVQQRLRDIFEERIISLDMANEWPPRSPDLTPCDFFLWGYLKNEVYTMPPLNLEDLRLRIEVQVGILKERPDMIMRSFGSMQTRVNRCVERNGRHVEGRVR